MDTNEIFIVISDTVLRVLRYLYSRPSKALFSFSQFRPQIVQLLAFLPNNGQKAAKLNPGKTKRRLTRLAGGGKTGKGEARLAGAKGKRAWEEVQNRQRRSKLGRGTSGKQAWQGGKTGKRQTRQGGQSSMSDDLLSRLTAETWAAKKNEAGEEGSGFRKESRQVTGSWQPAPLFADPCKLRDSQFGEDSHFSFAIYPLSDS